jgi:gluconolactonase
MHKHFSFLALSFFLISFGPLLGTSRAQESTTSERPSGDPSIVSFGARIERVFGDAFGTEGPTVAPDGSVYFSDITTTYRSGMQAGHIWRYDPKTGKTIVFRSPSGKSNGILFDREGRMVVAEGADFGGRRITRTDMTTGKSIILAGLFDGKPFNSPNDLTIDTSGRIYFTDPRYIGHEPVEQPVQGVYRIDVDASVHLVIADAGKPNGIAISPDQKTLYVACHDNGALGPLPEGMRSERGRMALLAYDLSPEGDASFRSVVVDYETKLAPDGIKVDEDGNLWLTSPNRPYGIAVCTPAGKQLAFIPVPESPRNLAFGRGLSSKTLYITTGKSLYRIEVSKDGYQPFH